MGLGPRWVGATILVAPALWLACSGTEPQAADAAKPPNIVLILADDLGRNDLGVYGSEVIETPHIDRLAAEGVLATQGYVSHPVCSPSRAGLVTGRYQQRHGWEFNPAFRDVGTGMSVDESTIADHLRAAGYATGLVGKWHLGYQAGHHPLDRGFDEFFGVLAGGSWFIDSGAPGVESMSETVGERPARIAISRGRAEVEVDRYLTDVFTDEAVGFIDRHREEPFFLYLSHTTPHTPLQATAKYLDRYRHIEDDATRIYAAMVSSLDDSVGRVVEKLEEIDASDDTLIVLLSDNGCAGYIAGACSNAPFRGFKRYHHEGGVRVPFILRWPTVLRPDQRYEQPISALDLLATFTAAAGRAVTTEDSVDLTPFLTGERDGRPHEHLFWRAGPSMAVLDARWKLIRYNLTHLTPADLDATGRLVPGDEGWPTDSPHGRLTMLYDLAADPGESSNVAAENPEVVAQLTAAYEVWSRDLATPILPPIRSTLAEIDGESVQLFF